MSLSPERINFSRTTYESSFCPVAGNFPYGEFRFINVAILISSSHKLFFIILSRDSAIAITRLHFCRASRHSVGERERERERPLPAQFLPSYCTFCITSRNGVSRCFVEIKSQPVFSLRNINSDLSAGMICYVGS